MNITNIIDTPKFVENFKATIGEQNKLAVDQATKQLREDVMDLLEAIGPPDAIRYEMDRLANEGFCVILARQGNYEVKDDNGATRVIPHWYCSCPTMKLNNIPRAHHTDPVECILECERELRKYLANPQYHHKP